MHGSPSPLALWRGEAVDLRVLTNEALGDSRLLALAHLLGGALGPETASQRWGAAIGLRLPRLGRRLDAVLSTGRAVLAILSRPAAAWADRREAEDAALDLADFHPASRRLPVIPVILVANGTLLRQQWPLPLPGAAAPLACSRLFLPALFARVAAFPETGQTAAAWDPDGYHPSPGLMDAARRLYADHNATVLQLASAGPDALGRARAAIDDALAGAGARPGARTVVFLTGVPGSGKTLVGLDLAFGTVDAAYLTGNPTLVHVLREALVRDAVAGGLSRAASRRRIEAVIQALPRFRDHYAADRGAPPERLLVIDEAQRCWTRAHAIRKTAKGAAPLAESEPGHLLDVAARREGAVALLCLIGGGQEIHDGEGGLAEWARALQTRPDWRVFAPDREPFVAADVDMRLHLAIPIRSVAAEQATAWVDAVLDDQPAKAARLAADLPGRFRVTRSLRRAREAMRPRGSRTAGLLVSSTARRLRAEGLGAVLPHQDDDAVARWFLDRWPDLRSSDALEVAATEFAVQGLELDGAIVGWDGDLIRGHGVWQARRFRATAWTRAGEEAARWRRNAYRVLLTRARHGTVIWVPRGDARDETRAPQTYDAVADFLLACGATPLEDTQVAPDSAPRSEPVALL